MNEEMVKKYNYIKESKYNKIGLKYRPVLISAQQRDLNLKSVWEITIFDLLSSLFDYIESTFKQHLKSLLSLTQKDTYFFNIFNFKNENSNNMLRMNTEENVQNLKEFKKLEEKIIKDLSQLKENKESNNQFQMKIENF